MLIPALLKQLGVRYLLDAPCGDYNWFRLIVRESGFSYVGGDIVSPLVKKNQEAYGNDDTRFVVLDIPKDTFPEADLWLASTGRVCCYDMRVPAPNHT